MNPVISTVRVMVKVPYGREAGSACTVRYTHFPMVELGGIRWGMGGDRDVNKSWDQG